MYMPKYHAMTDVSEMQAHLDEHPLGAWVFSGDAGLVANHIPFVLDRSAGEFGRLLGHVSRANPVWRQLAQGAASVVMFMGPQAYITPAWYPGKQDHGKVVPTWNYITVHAHGAMRAVEDASWTLDMLNRLTDAQESGRPDPWRVGDAPADYVRQTLRGIVGIELTIERLEGRLKLSQDEALADRQGTVEGLRREPDSGSHELARRVEQQLNPLSQPRS